MAFKYFTFLALVAIASAGQIAYQQSPVFVKQLSAPIITKQIQYEAPAEYDFNYAVNDAYTGDVKSQQETRKGDHVVGQYSLIDADGYQRIVDYTADEHSGFNAVVRREPLSGYKQAAPAVQKVYATAPVAKYVSAAPVVTKYIQSPVAYAAGPIAQYNHGVGQVAYSAPAHSYHY